MWPSVHKNSGYKEVKLGVHSRAKLWQQQKKNSCGRMECRHITDLAVTCQIGATFMSRKKEVVAKRKVLLFFRKKERSRVNITCMLPSWLRPDNRQALSTCNLYMSCTCEFALLRQCFAAEVVEETRSWRIRTPHSVAAAVKFLLKMHSAPSATKCKLRMLPVRVCQSHEGPLRNGHIPGAVDYAVPIRRPDRI